MDCLTSDVEGGKKERQVVDVIDIKPAAGGHGMWVDEGETYACLGEVEVGLTPLTLRCSTDGRTAFVANVLAGTVSVVDLVEMRMVRTLDVDLVRREDKDFHQGAHGLAVID